MSVSKLRKLLHSEVKKGNEIELEDVRTVNTFDRLERMKNEMRILVTFVNSDETHELFENIGTVALDWVHGPELDWENSVAAKMGKRLYELSLKEINVDTL